MTEVDMKTDVEQPAAATPWAIKPAAAFSAAIYIAAFVTGAIVMSFEMLGSRYLNPYFGSGIYTWAALISTVLAALTAGYFLGGYIADRTVSAAVLGMIVCLASLYLLILPSFAEAILTFVLDAVENVRLGSLYSALAIMFLPVMLLGVYSPFAIRLLLQATQHSGTVSGTVYGVSTAGSIVGTLGTTFYLIPLLGTRSITLLLGAAGLVCGLCLMLLQRIHWRGQSMPTGLIAFCGLLLQINCARPENVFDPNIRAETLNHSDGRIAHIETGYNNIFINKRGTYLTLSTRFRSKNSVESIVDLTDPDNIPLEYAQTMTVVLLYPETPKRILMIGLGAGSISTYLARALPETQIDAVELDPGVITAGKQYFGLRETEKVHLIESDGRVYLNRHKDRLYDLILLDAFRESGVPFHLLTREFYDLVKERLAPGGAAAISIYSGTKLFRSTLVTLRAVFQTVDLYPGWSAPDESQAIAVATPGKGPNRDTLMQRAIALQGQRHFRYAMPALLEKRAVEQSAEGGELLTDDFSPVNLYETMPVKPHGR
jgi:spermidine synthase